MGARQIISVTGTDPVEFLQNLVTNDVGRLKDGLVWTALLTPQGKYLADFFLLRQGDTNLLGVVLNQVDTRREGRGYGSRYYQYYYYYRSGYTDDGEREQKASA